LKNPEQLQYSFICFYTFAPRSFGLAPTVKNIMKVDSLRSHVAIVVALGSLSSLHGDGNENVEKQKGFNEQKNDSTRALHILVHFFSVLCKTTT